MAVKFLVQKIKFVFAFCGVVKKVSDFRIDSHLRTNKMFMSTLPKF